MTTPPPLLPCPFCGVAPENEYANGCRYIYCMNEKCEVRPHVNTGPDEMGRRGLKREDYEKWTAEQWNTRAQPAPMEVTDEMVERAFNAYNEAIFHGDEGCNYRALTAALTAALTPKATTPPGELT